MVMTIDIDIEDVLDDCSSWEIDYVINWLKRNDYIKNNYVVSDNEYEGDNIMDIEFKTAIDKIRDKRLNISLEDEALIKQIANKL
jgi:Ser-tRNA(Ala) deacylase AlaX